MCRWYTAGAVLLADRDRALAILQRHGYATVSFQLLASELSYWFDGDDAFAHPRQF